MHLFRRKPATAMERISQSLRNISEEARDMLDSVSHDAGRQVRDRLAGIADYANETSHQIERQVRRNARVVNSVVHSHPYECVGVAFGVGLLLGLVAARR